MRSERYSIHPERTYCNWIRQFVKFHQTQERVALFVVPEKKIVR